MCLSKPRAKAAKQIAGHRALELMEPLAKQLPNGAHAHEAKHEISMSAEYRRCGIQSEYCLQPRLQAGSNDEDQRGKVEKPHGVSTPLRTC
jgi:hypothetical protein